MNCIIVHGCPSSMQEEKNRTYAKHWLPWVKDKLNAEGIKTEIALMPEPWHPVYSKFKNAFKKYDINEESILIGHSCGAAFLVRWLGETKRRVNKLILIAPWKIPYADGGFRKKFYTYVIDPTIKDRVKEIIMFTSDNEDPRGKQSLEIFHKVLGGKIIELPNHGHYIFSDMGTEEFPELLKYI